ncbi:CRISPR-associated CARF protein Csa3 [Aeropyrum camini]|uniref:Predicted transcriptional regulator n=1 Tax=Aeropyrum camini SY1 = JCM 12091 TaxID=1198449 RepID=U3TER6_9CREN|nr:CRISPR-associated CARF protein Csa3 [Aeropyrum camini]BAN89819.1 predicted transcriptional regulator [Aeropyrum camini SY1 = JCM 12091]
MLVASIGFTVDFIIRRLADLRGGQSVSRVVAVGLDVGDGSWSRVEQTYSLLNHYLASMSIDSTLEKLHLGPRLVPQARDLIYREASSFDGDVELYLSGGPRMLIVTLMLAAYSLDINTSSKIVVVSYGEGFPGSIEFRLIHAKILSSLDKQSLTILKAIASGNDNVKSLIETLDMPRSTLYKKLEDLEKMGLAKKISRGRWVLEEGLDKLL